MVRLKIMTNTKMKIGNYWFLKQVQANFFIFCVKFSRTHTLRLFWKTSNVQSMITQFLVFFASEFKFSGYQVSNTAESGVKDERLLSHRIDVN